MNGVDVRGTLLSSLQVWGDLIASSVSEKIRFPDENYYTGHVPEQLCSNFRCQSDRRSPKPCFPEILAAIRSQAACLDVRGTLLSSLQV